MFHWIIRENGSGSLVTVKHVLHTTKQMSKVGMGALAKKQLLKSMQNGEHGELSKRRKGFRRRASSRISAKQHVTQTLSVDTGEWFENGYGETCESYHAADIGGGWGSPCEKTAASINTEWGSWGTFVAPKGYTNTSLFKEFCRNTCNTFDMSLQNTGEWFGKFGYGETCESYHKADMEGGWGSPCHKTAGAINTEWGTWGTFVAPKGFTNSSLFKDFCRGTCHYDSSLKNTGEWFGKFDTEKPANHITQQMCLEDKVRSKTAAAINAEWGTWELSLPLPVTQTPVHLVNFVKRHVVPVRTITHTNK